MNIGLFFGSFNPVHTGHLIIANYFLNETDIEKIWFVLSPQNPFKKSNDLLNENNRLELLQKAVQIDERIVASEIEFGLPKPSYTINTLNHLKENFPGNEYSIIMGSDNFKQIENWKEPDKIIRDHKIFVYARPGYEVQDSGKIKIADAPLVDISSTAIRQLIKGGKSIRYLVPEPVREEIEKRGFYK